MGKKKLVRSRTYMLLNVQALAAVRLPYTIFQVRGRRVCQVTTSSLVHTLNTNDCLIVCFVEKGAAGDSRPETKVINRVLLWIGAGSSDETQQTAEECATALYPLYMPFEGCPEVLQEGEEKVLIDALAEHNTVPEGLSPISVDQQGIRLFQCSTSTGNFEAEEIKLPTHSDLANSSMFIIDASPTSIYVWEGKSASSGGQEETQKVASEYAKLVQEHKKLPNSVPVEYLKQGAETPLFKSFFLGWPTTEKLKAKQQAPRNRRAMMDKNALAAFRSTREFQRPVLRRSETERPAAKKPFVRPPMIR